MVQNSPHSLKLKSLDYFNRFLGKISRGSTQYSTIVEIIVVGLDMDDGDVLNWLQKTAFTLPALESLTRVNLDFDGVSVSFPEAIIISGLVLM